MKENNYRKVAAFLMLNLLWKEQSGVPQKLMQGNVIIYRRFVANECLASVQARSQSSLH